MKTKLTLLLTISLVLTGIFAPLAAQSIRPMIRDDHEFSTIARGIYSAWPSQDFLIIQDQETWQQVWGIMTSNFNPQPIIPLVNFSRHMVIAVFIGPSLSMCYHVEITDIYTDEKHQIVSIEATPTPRWLSRGFSRNTAQINPHHIVITEKNDLLTRFILTRPDGKEKISQKG